MRPGLTRVPYLCSTRAVHWLATLTLLAGAAGGTAPADERANSSVVLLVGTRGVYRSAAAAAAQGLTASRIAFTTHRVESGQQLSQLLQQLRRHPPRVIVATGAALTQAALDAVPDVPVVFLVVPNVADAPFLVPDSPYRKRVVGVTSDIDPVEQLRWIRKLTPRCKRLVVLYSTCTSETSARLAEAGKRAGVQVTPIRAARNEFARAIQQAEQLEACGVLMLPDAAVYDAGTIRALLLWGLKKRKAVWTFSEKLVESGALGGLYADPTAIGRRGAQLVEQILKDGGIRRPGFYYPAARVAVNVRTARLIEWRLEPDALAANVTRFPRREGARP